MAWDAVLGKMECCDPCSIQWSDTALTLTWIKTEIEGDSSYYYFSAVFGVVRPQVTVIPLFGEVLNFTPCSTQPPFIEVQYQNNNGSLSVLYKVLKMSPSLTPSDRFVPATFTQDITLQLTYDGITRTVTNTFTSTIPSEYQQNTSPCIIP
jgi:hypothetical protein